MSLQDLGNLGELIVATVLTLAYLAIQLKQNTNALQDLKHFNKVVWI